jgi:pyruvate kinase
MIRAGMDVARLNFSHGDYSFHKRLIQMVRRAAKRLDRPVAILQDLSGPKIRLGAIEGDRVSLRTGQEFVLTSRSVVGNQSIASVNFSHFPRHLKKGDPIVLGDGEIELQAVRVGEDEVVCKVVVGDDLGSHKGIHFSRGTLGLASLTRKDRKDLSFGVSLGVDLVALSFVRHRKDVSGLREEMKKRGAEIPIIAKIEKHEALDHIDSILEEVDGIMVARGDLGLEIAPETIPAVQKTIIAKANLLGKPVITATQLLKSMVDNRRPTRAEVADIANAVLDGSDALMLSEESAIGKYPIEAVKTMAKIAAETEKILKPRRDMEANLETVPEAICHAAISLARDLKVKALLVPTASGSTARMIARYRPSQPIIAISQNRRTVQSLCMAWGIYAFLVPYFENTYAVIKSALKKAVEAGAAKKGDLVVITAGLPLHEPGTTNLITVKVVD